VAAAERFSLPREGVSWPALLPEVPAEFVVEVDVADLAARILGVNSALRTLEAELEDSALAPEECNAARLTEITDRLESLLRQRRDLAAYRQVVPSWRQFLVPQLASAERIFSLLGRRIFEARRHTAGPEFRGTEAMRRLELRRLEELSRRLARLAAGG